MGGCFLRKRIAGKPLARVHQSGRCCELQKRKGWVEQHGCAARYASVLGADEWRNATLDRPQIYAGPYLQTPRSCGMTHDAMQDRLLDVENRQHRLQCVHGEHTPLIDGTLSTIRANATLRSWLAPACELGGSSCPPSTPQRLSLVVRCFREHFESRHGQCTLRTS